MDLAELDLLRSDAAEALLSTLSESDSAPSELVLRLRKAGHEPELVAAVVAQHDLRRRARAKFGTDAERMLFTRAGLEQATRQPVAALRAQRFVDAGLTRVADLGCGIGGDSLDYARAGLSVLAVDADEVTAALAAHNLRGTTAHARHAFAQDVDTSEMDALWFDPARRTSGHRETRRVQPEDYSPPLDWVFSAASRIPSGIKLGPAHDRDDVPEDAETQWTSVDGQLIELALWTGALARDGVRRSALVIRGGNAHEMTAPADSPDAEVRDIGRFLYEPDGAVIRARLIGDLAREMNAGMLDEHIAYLSSDEERDTPFAAGFAVRELWPLDAKKIARALRERRIGRLEIKKRGVDIDPATFRTRLKLSGTEEATLLLTRIGERRVALLADRL